jgi:hypothetical protein
MENAPGPQQVGSSIRPVRIIAAVTIVLAALSAAAVMASPARAQSACGREIIDEWVRSETVATNYPLHCYRDAIKLVPNDLRDYSGIIEDIQSARQRATRGNLRFPSGSNLQPTQQAQAKPNDGLFKQAFDTANPRNVDTVPLPLLILAGLSVALITAGGAGLVARRVKARKIPG